MHPVLQIACNCIYCLILLGLRAIYAYEAKSLVDQFGGLSTLGCLGVIGAIWMTLAVTFVGRLAKFPSSGCRLMSEIVIEALILVINTATAWSSSAFGVTFAFLVTAQVLEAYLSEVRPHLMEALKKAGRRSLSPRKRTHLGVSAGTAGTGQIPFNWLDRARIFLRGIRGFVLRLTPGVGGSQAISGQRDQFDETPSRWTKENDPTSDVSSEEERAEKTVSRGTSPPRTKATSKKKGRRKTPALGI
jgi:hypothetical protein